MAFTLDVSVSLGSGQTGLTDLRAQLIDNAGNVGSPVSTGFSEIGGGSYLWHYTAWPDNFQGGVKVYSDAAPTVMAFIAINPADAGILLTPDETAGRPTTLNGMIRRVFEWMANLRTRDRDTGTVLLRNSANDATLETQTQSTSGNVDTQTKGV